eukprot:gene4775-8361_t
MATQDEKINSLQDEEYRILEVIQICENILENIKNTKSEMETVELISKFTSNLKKIKMNLSQHIEEVSKYSQNVSEISIYEREKKYELLIEKLKYIDGKLNI